MKNEKTESFRIRNPARSRALSAAPAPDQAMSWEHPDAARYSAAISAKIPGHADLYGMGVRLLREIADRLKPGAPLLLASLNADFDCPVYPAVMEAWRTHMLDGGVPEEEWLRFAASLGPKSDPIPVPVVERLLEECGFGPAVRYFGSFLIDGWLTCRNGEEAR
ncbi:hypothetical protein [Saccharibacillus alkalitolerans]|uniref:Uncharacterized protein n=1 Tax=Saccharibacillus alkalitolerans TaxID=2705290 RepID=A0ABX0F461_9BACL|nr:hypothetical protein [Saccharibacillus alkalitolerans]NGZ74384.1 hypothetical protein [Saccharibacillus alkalitolerans]